MLWDVACALTEASLPIFPTSVLQALLQVAADILRKVVGSAEGGAGEEEGTGAVASPTGGARPSLSGARYGSTPSYFDTHQVDVGFVYRTRKNGGILVKPGRGVLYFCCAWRGRGRGNQLVMLFAAFSSAWQYLLAAQLDSSSALTFAGVEGVCNHDTRTGKVNHPRGGLPGA